MKKRTYAEQREIDRKRKAAKLATRPYRPRVSYSSDGRNKRRLKRAVAGGSDIRSDLMKLPKDTRGAPDLTGKIPI